ncbi:type I 3-dehydroquinate dehydratase [Thermocrinis jamiesonii]|uniref:type I 3-dehydroquinate dehydratase n=1 Tax=Thermocrinis jamiesonii TaxID=1302351 RepID=UPI0004984D63|nr:type I 3-dehydroquinate dehydratase [Thermocrinis jamiesonii]
MLIAVPLSDQNLEEDLRAVKELGADIVELRIDMFERTEPDYVLSWVKRAKELGLSTILTIRSSQEGGKDVPNRERIFELVSPYADYTDIELSSRALIPYVRNITKASGKKLIISYHNFELTPANWILREVFREGMRWGADIVKVAVKANSYEDTARLLCVARQEEGQKIIISMGKYGKISRVSGFIFGSVISYAYYRQATAEGQLSLEEMVKLREILYS